MAAKNLTLLLFVFLLGCGQAPHSIPPEARAEVMADLGLTEGFDPIIAATRAREFVYVTSNPLPADDSPSGFAHDPAAAFVAYRQFKAGETNYFCAGLAEIYYFMLTTLGIEARIVSLVSQPYFDGLGYESHVSNEALLDGEWVSMDPTFNVTYQCDGQDASFEELFACKANGGIITWAYGSTVFSKRSLEVYPATINDLLYGWSFYPATTIPYGEPIHP